MKYTTHVLFISSYLTNNAKAEKTLQAKPFINYTVSQKSVHISFVKLPID